MRNRLRPLGLAAAVVALAGCASFAPRRPTATEASHWSGRLALRVLDDPPQAFTAAFDLRGSPEQGELALYTPLGSTAAVLSWSPDRAVLREEGRLPQGFDSIDELLRQALGAAIPVAALFDWLRGTPTDVPGWRADLSQRAEGRLQARRTDPLPAADLRIVLDTP